MARARAAPPLPRRATALSSPRRTSERPTEPPRASRACAARKLRYAFELEDDTDDNPLDEDEDVIFTCRGVDGARVVVDEGSLELVTDC